MKKIYNLFFLILFIISILLINFSKTDILIDNVQNDCSGNEPIYDTYSEIINDLDETFGEYNGYYLTCDSTYAMLSIINYSQSYLQSFYNNLGNMRFDLNHDGMINNYDNIGQNGGVCQPTACSIALKYMIDRNLISYEPRLSNDMTDINNIMYEVVDSYIANNWGGNGADAYLASSSLNLFFSNNNLPYSASLHTSNYIQILNNSYNSALPCIAHIQMYDTRHAATVCGYYKITVHYYRFQQITLDYYYLIINDGWVNSGFNYGSNSQEIFDLNYSYISISNVYSLTKIV